MWHTPFLFVCFFVLLLKKGGKKKKNPPKSWCPFSLHSHKLYSHSDRLPFSQQSAFLQRKEKCKTKQSKSCGFWFGFFWKKQDACHVDKLAPSCLPRRDFNDLSNLVRNANAIKLVVNVRKVLTPHQNISMYKTHGTKKKEEKACLENTFHDHKSLLTTCVTKTWPLSLSLSFSIYIYNISSLSIY